MWKSEWSKGAAQISSVDCPVGYIKTRHGTLVKIADVVPSRYEQQEMLRNQTLDRIEKKYRERDSEFAEKNRVEAPDEPPIKNPMGGPAKHIFYATETQ